MQLTGIQDEGDDDTPITLLLAKEEPIDDEANAIEDPTVQVINGKLHVYNVFINWDIIYK